MASKPTKKPDPKATKPAPPPPVAPLAVDGVTRPKMGVRLPHDVVRDQKTMVRRNAIEAARWKRCAGAKPLAEWLRDQANAAAEKCSGNG